MPTEALKNLPSNLRQTPYNQANALHRSPTMQPPSRETPYNLNNELARERNRQAAERTLMAWIRTCLVNDLLFLILQIMRYVENYSVQTYYPVSIVSII